MRRVWGVFAVVGVLALVPAPASADATELTCAFRPIIATEGPALAPCQGVRPGGALIVKSGEFDVIYCTMAFLVTDGTDVYLTTAGHCTLEEFGVPTLGQDTYAHGVDGPIGKVVYTWCEGRAANGGCGGGTDFGMIKLNANGVKHANPAMCGWSAPAGIFRDHDLVVRETRHTGWGSGIGGAGAGTRLNGQLVQPGNPITQSRRSIGIDFSDDNAVLGWGAAIPGDSGSGMLVTDLPQAPSTHQNAPNALGVLTHISAGGLQIIQRLDVSLAKAGRDLHARFSLWRPSASR
ncbi:MAG TPA: hypothetical protein VFA34_14085 [Actinomycetota bacterium]|jgi:hypothetical protein|nr:hypothetical protein [Actinomycetota bacterium]